MPKNKPTPYPKEELTPIAQWVDTWLTTNEEGWTPLTVSKRMDIARSTVSHWRVARAVPDPRQLGILAEISGESLWHLAHLAYGWPDVPSSDPLLKQPELREIAHLLSQIYKLAPERVSLAGELLRGVLRDARKDKQE